MLGEGRTRAEANGREKAGIILRAGAGERGKVGVGERGRVRAKAGDHGLRHTETEHRGREGNLGHHATPVAVLRTTFKPRQIPM